MAAAVALRKADAVEDVNAPSRDEVLARYRHLREIGKQHHSKVLDFLSEDAVLRHARKLGLAVGRTLILDSMDVLTLAFDLAIYTAPADRSRAIDRYGRSARPAPGSDEALMLDAMRRARFAIVRVVCRYEAVGLIVSDVFRRSEHWLVDEGLEVSMPDDSAFATRLFTPDRFFMTAGVIVPLDVELMEDALAETPILLRKLPAEVPDDRRFAEAIYRIAIADGIMEQVEYRDPTPAAG